MMPLKYMVNDTDKAARNLLAKWNPAPTEVHFFRASSNYVHIFKNNGDWNFLRFSRNEERDLRTLEAELEYLLYLKEHGFPATYPVLSKDGKYIETGSDSHGCYYGMVFEKARGIQLSAEDRTPEQYLAWGRELGRLHNLSRKFSPKSPRSSYLDYCALFRKSFSQWGESAALEELDSVQKSFDRMEQNPENYGLIHYDYQYDNTFWNDEEQTFYAIDFDDSHYHFYTMDIVYALEDMDDGPDNPAECIEAFYRGYKSISPLDEKTLARRDLFERYSNLMHFWRITRSLEDSSFEQDPQWLKELRPRLLERCIQLRKGFQSNAHSG